MKNTGIHPFKTAFTTDLKVALPIIVAPMFLVSNVEMVVAASEAGAIGAFPALNFRPVEQYRKALEEIKSRTKKPIAVNIIVNKSNQRQGDDLRHGLETGVELFITSLGSPQTVITEAHKNGAKVFCDVTNLEHARKVQDMGADGVIAVAHGAGGHAGPISPLVLIPWLKRNLEIPVIAAGGIANGETLTAALALGAAGVSVGTRFIASREARVDNAYKEAIVHSTPEDIVLTTRVSGTPANVIETDYIRKAGVKLPWILEQLKNNPRTKKYTVPLIHYLGMKDLEKAATQATWKTVWSAGQSVGLVDSIASVREILEQMTDECMKSVQSLNHITS